MEPVGGFFLLRERLPPNGATMRIASNCQDRALLLLQIAQECPQFKEQAAYLALERLVDLER
jgi:hypothetical protein